MDRVRFFSKRASGVKNADDPTEQYVLALDLGTSSTRAAVFSNAGVVVGFHQIEQKQIYPQAGWVEHSPQGMWESTQACVQAALQQVNATHANIAAVGITNQRETTIVWNRETGMPYHNAIVWNDTRASAICDKLARVGGRDRLRNKTGLPITPYFSAVKLMWLLENVPGLREACDNGEALFGTVDTWIVWKLTNGALHVTDVTNASRTSLMNLHTLDWDDELLQIHGIPRGILPEIRSSSERYGEAQELLPGVPIAGILGDQQAALFGQNCLSPGQGKSTYGTGAFLLFNIGERIMLSESGLLTTVAFRIGDQPAVYALEGSVAYSGSLIQWLRDNLNIITSNSESETLAATVPDNGGVYLVPAFSGLYAPYWRSDARGVLVGLTAFNTRAHVARAALEAAAFQAAEVLSAAHMDSGVKLEMLKVDGGMTANELLMQFQADVLGVPVTRPRITETASLGAAFAAGLAVGFWESVDALADIWVADRTWEPAMSEDRRCALMRDWRRAVKRSLNWVESEHVEVDDHLSPGATPRVRAASGASAAEGAEEPAAPAAAGSGGTGPWAVAATGLACFAAGALAAMAASRGGAEARAGPGRGRRKALGW
eukprot:CAMPEP_0198441872 /NCGR_PEP_ID=MMETSP1452-20131203/64365_1 /TAXON_ID=1181717 /ORGANISM="Synchroma pusillum, Strain CCMP3072" /LENGTH=603 /DNA_ID=CAMNT_0044162501 /DNA_START=1 /DNA_END=1810 /DNA_ORIENTATION=+